MSGSPNLPMWDTRWVERFKLHVLWWPSMMDLWQRRLHISHTKASAFVSGDDHFKCLLALGYSDAIRMASSCNINHTWAEQQNKLNWTDHKTGLGLSLALTLTDPQFEIKSLEHTKGVGQKQHKEFYKISKICVVNARVPLLRLAVFAKCGEITSMLQDQ